MDAHVALKPKLTRLKLSGILETFQARMDQAQKDKWSYSQFLDFLFRRMHFDQDVVKPITPSEIFALIIHRVS